MKKSINNLSFFSGALGLDLGFESVGINPLITCDYDKHCRNTIFLNRPELPVLEDILNYTASDIRKTAGLKKGQRPTIVSGGPPCQAFSTAGKRRAFNDPRGNVFLYFIDLALELDPEYIVIENVRGLLSAPLQHKPHSERVERNSPVSLEETPGSALAYVVNLLESGGYNLSFNLYNAANYGVPQKRERVILIGTKNKNKVPFLRPTHSEDGVFDLKRWVTFVEAVHDLNNSEMTGLSFPEKRLVYYRMLKSGQYWKDLPSEEIKMKALGKSYFSGGGKTGFLRRLDWDKPSPTLVTHPAMPATDLAHPEEDRPLSIQEYKRIQQFPDDWMLAGGITQQYKQLGNAVPVGLGAAVGKTILDHMNNEVISDNLMGFPYSRYKYTDDESWMAQYNERVHKAKCAMKQQELLLS